MEGEAKAKGFKAQTKSLRHSFARLLPWVQNLGVTGVAVQNLGVTGLQFKILELTDIAVQNLGQIKSSMTHARSEAGHSCKRTH